MRAQIKYGGKIESSSLQFLGHTVSIDPSEAWQGYNLKGDNGWSAALSNGIAMDNRFYSGMGLSYFNFKGIHGVAYYLDIDILTSPKRLSALINLNLGSSQVWNQYKGGTHTGLFQLSLGTQYRIKENSAIYIKVGALFTQQSVLIPIALGYKF